ncbi:MAG: carboxypeptidase regulatory-like domain-containing protein [Candidatus Eremiobacteraeota bacterium]|nr:carboxypeptidase regulatory-like domain-containing protein [Candidatus Eremiobacteraeota bacterium]
MKYLMIMLALAGSVAAAARADEPAGLSGTVVDVKSGQPISHATLYYYRAPYLEHGPNRIMTLQTNARGFFSDVTLEPGRYVIMARFPNKVEGCAVDDVIGGEVARVKIEMGHDTIMCSGPRVHAALVDPNAGADVYRI